MPAIAANLAPARARGGSPLLEGSRKAGPHRARTPQGEETLQCPSTGPDGLSCKSRVRPTCRIACCVPSTTRRWTSRPGLRLARSGNPVKSAACVQNLGSGDRLSRLGHRRVGGRAGQRALARRHRADEPHRVVRNAVAGNGAEPRPAARDYSSSLTAGAPPACRTAPAASRRRWNTWPGTPEGRLPKRYSRAETSVRKSRSIL